MAASKDDPGPAGPRAPNEPDELTHRREQRRAGRETPCDLATERALLDAAMRDPDAAGIVAALPNGAFWGGTNKLVAQAIADLERDGEPVDPHVVAHRLTTSGDIDAAGGLQGVIDITFEGGFPSSAPAYARALMELHQLRTMIEAATSALDAAYRHDLTLAKGCMATAVDDMPADDTPSDVADLAQPYLELLMAREAGTAVGRPTGMVDLDELIGGLHAGNFVVVGARTGVGKTATLCQLTLNLAKQGARVLYVSLEMPWGELIDRWIGNLAWLDTRRLRRGEMGEDGWVKATGAIEKLVPLGIRVAKPTTMTVPAIRGEARQHGADVVIVDYLQLVHAVGRRNTNRENDVGEISRSLKGMALALGVPVVAAAQLNRNLEGRVLKRPELADLRDSGQIEQDADVVIMAYREHQHDNEADPTDIELIVRKNRHGETGTAHMTFLGATQHVVDRAPETRVRSS